ncbi:MAG: hypothetical protein ABIJ23_01930 [Candidatus Magasanikbacteria bacterium]
MKYIDLENGLMKLKPVFTAKDIKLAGFKVFPYQLNQWTKAGYIKKLMAGYYVFSRVDVIPEFIANQLRQPSYISLEYALYIHNLIVDIPFHITSVTSKNTRKTLVGDMVFFYHHIKPEFFNGFFVKESVNNKEVGRSFYLASPEKALVDLFYLKPNAFKNDNQFSEARFHEEDIKKIDWRGVFEIAKLFNNKSLEKRLENFKNYIFSI